LVKSHPKNIIFCASGAPAGGQILKIWTNGFGELAHVNGIDGFTKKNLFWYPYSKRLAASRD
jgi:hypothetical protein